MEIKDVEFEDVKATESTADKTAGTTEDTLADRSFAEYERGNRENKHVGFMVAGILLLIAALGVLAVTIIYAGRNRYATTSTSIKHPSGVSVIGQTYTQSEVDELIREAARISGEEAAEETAGEYLQKIMEATSVDGGTINLFKSLFPNYVIFAEGSRYVYVPIDKKLKPNTLKHSGFSTDPFTGFLKYSEEGKDSKSHIGIDVSRHQGEINWEEVASSGVEFVIIKCGIRGYGSEGNFAEDVMYRTYIEGAMKAGLHVGVYFLTQAVTIDEAVDEAEYVLELIGDYKIDGPVALDVEYAAADERTKDLSAEDRTTNIIYFCDTIKAAGYNPVIYANTKYFIRKMDMSRLEAYDKWYANYNKLVPAPEKTIWEYNDPLYFPYEIAIWQYTASGSIPGITTPTDIDILFDKWW